MTNNSKLTSFWNLVKEKDIVIPIIQRDYAQGRLGQEYLRERFLKQLLQALETKKALVLDFVYGSYENNILYPLDGQQRLTTLWLLHWYLSLCTGSLELDQEVLTHFSYATRISSRTFCEKLCSIKYEYNRKTGAEYNKEENIVAFIRNQHWFYTSYEQDPTIQSMLRMLGGTTKADKDGNDIVDGIEEFCKNLPQKTLEGYLKLLKSADSPIKFYTLDMEDKNLPLSDDLYIKMNARGKVLTDFENFKVDLLNYKPDGETPLIAEDGKTEDSFSHLLDTDWTDIFWHSRSSGHKIDGIFLKFLNRYFLNWFMAHYEGDGKPESVTGHTFYKTLTEKNSSGYKNINLYENVLNKECINFLYTCMNNLHALYCLIKKQEGEENLSEKVNRLFLPYWKEVAGEGTDTRKFYFVPKYLEDGSISTITVQQRVAMHAIFVYLKNCNDITTENLQSWMHFVWNILENSYIDKEQAVSAIRFFDKILPSLSQDTSINMTNDIAGYLASIDENKLPGEIFGKKQLVVEILKARKSLNNEEWKKKIEDAERLYFFKGAIAFLFNDADGQPTAWDLFDRKLEKAKQIFDENGLKKDYLIDTLYCLYSYCDNWDAQFWWSHKIFNGLAATWKDNILTLVDRNYRYVYASPIHHILMGDEPRTEIIDKKIKTLSNRSLIEYILKRNENKRDMYIRWPYDALYFCGDKHGVLLSYGFRNQAISALLKDTRFLLVNEDIRIPGTNLFWGFDIDILFHPIPEKTIRFRWYRENNNKTYDIYIMDDQWNYIQRPNEKPEAQGDKKNYYCFNVGSSLSNIVETIANDLMSEQSEIDSNI